MATSPPYTAHDDEAAARAILQHAVNNAFEIRERIGRGGFADVFCAFDPQLKRTVAIKAIRRDLSPTPELLARFRREAESIAALRHPNLLPIHAIGERDGTLYLVLEHIHGETLDRYIRREQQAEIGDAVRILREVAGALAAAHSAGLVHRDLKPANIMLEAPDGRALLMDFGLAGALDDVAGAGPAEHAGTPHYLSPEQAAGDRIDHRADIYALGVVGYELICGLPPFDDDAAPNILLQHLSRLPTPLRRLRPDCPAHVAHAIERCLAKSPAERWQSVQSFAAALSVAADTSSDGIDRVPDERLIRRRSFLIAAGAAVGLAAASLVVDAATSSELSWSVVVAGSAPLYIALRFARLWRDGDSLHAVLRGDSAPQPDPEEEEFGRHSASVRTARKDRARIVRMLAGMPRREQAELARCGPAADALLARCTQLARQLRALDQQIAAERAHERAGSRKLLSELLATREHATEELSASARHLGELQELVARAQSDPATVLPALSVLLHGAGAGRLAQ